MGIDVFLEWDGQKEEREEAAGDKPQLFCTTDGHVGYLREAYHGGPYATKLLVREAFESETCRAEIPAAIMRERLTNITEPARGADGGHNAAFALVRLFQERNKNKNGELAISPPDIASGETVPMSVEAAVRIRQKMLYNSAEEDIEEVVQSFRDFVELAERKEAELGKPCAVYASY